jgi:hypothetical protein
MVTPMTPFSVGEFLPLLVRHKVFWQLPDVKMKIRGSSCHIPEPVAKPGIEQNANTGVFLQGYFFTVFWHYPEAVLGGDRAIKLSHIVLFPRRLSPT